MLRLFEEKDRGRVNELLLHSKFPALPDRPGGISIVLLKDSEVVGFCWALWSPDSDVAYVDYLVVDGKHRNTGAASLLTSTVLAQLAKRGVRWINGVVLDQSEITVAKLYKSVGMDVDAGFVIRGQIGSMIPNIEKHKVKHGRQDNYTIN